MPHHSFECLVAAGTVSVIDSNTASLAALNHFLASSHWKFGHLSYDLKNKLYPLQSKPNLIGFADFFFFVPQHVVYIKDNRLFIESANAEKVYEEIIKTSAVIESSPHSVFVNSRLTKQQYIEKINGLKKHIQRGDCYEINFCQEFFAENISVDAFSVFHELTKVSPNPFSVFYRNDERYLLCASPERFIKKEGDKIISQPIKGTSKRNVADSIKDEDAKNYLQTSKKERAENVMIVDLVRNDLSKICKRHSVGVDELFGIYSFPQVHQMISTISGTLSENISFSKIIEALFPMGSMTGAPKFRVLQLIDEFEESSRGIFSGSVGYISPNGDFDFNVVIRSIMYNSASKYLSYHVGSGITFYSDAEKEWDECLLKAEAIKKVLNASPALSN